MDLQVPHARDDQSGSRGAALDLEALRRRYPGRVYWEMLDSCPKVPMFRLDKVDPLWVSREHAHTLLGKFPPHTRGMMIMALATGMRRSNATTCPGCRPRLDSFQMF